jgi:peptidoglycan/LPS O-acetylase OafA/YrhL
VGRAAREPTYYGLPIWQRTRVSPLLWTVVLVGLFAITAIAAYYFVDHLLPDDEQRNWFASRPTILWLIALGIALVGGDVAHLDGSLNGGRTSG